MNDLVISIIIPTYNREKTIGYCLDSVVHQTYKNIEVIIVDDCSTDRTLDVVKNYNDKRIKIVKLSQKSGAQKARNEGIKAACGEWIAFQDSDDEWFLDKLERQMQVLNDNNFDKYLVVHSDAILFDTIKNEKKLFNIARTNGDDVYRELLERSAPFFQAILTSKQALEEIGYLDEKVPAFQEWDTSIRLSQICRFVQMEAPTFLYYYHDGDTISKGKELFLDGYDYVVHKFESEIKQKCGLKVWERHMLNQYRNATQWGLQQRRKYYFNQLSLRKRASYFFRLKFNDFCELIKK